MHATVREIEKHIAGLRIKEEHRLDNLQSFLESVEWKAVPETIALLRRRTPALDPEDRKSLQRQLHRLGGKHSFLKAQHKSAKQAVLDYEVFSGLRRDIVDEQR